jgi:hypothetical protein
MRANSEKKDSRADRIDDGEQRDERYANPGEKVTRAFQREPLGCCLTQDAVSGVSLNLNIDLSSLTQPSHPCSNS